MCEVCLAQSVLIINTMKKSTVCTGNKYMLSLYASNK